ncbi:DUF2332 domain-containing protein [Inhella gelatinilytica]|uniref:DUF2332 domain-containing protein n=1 Tax=Inhella gelatinilytica TaxID=2795030 RepID=A0A931NF40_9BURK|nr:DUF2332 domain-containing protein [Inhella gelatinilytica]MBH9554359.1 DUF2332 domain-containing protein [Inhella gelatinilytica]
MTMPLDEQRTWAQRYLHFAAHECPDEAVYVALCLAVAADPELLALHDEVPPSQARPNLLLAALHERLLADPRDPLAAYFPNLGGTRAPDADLPAALRALALGPQRAVLRQHLRSRATQTNEAGRTALLRLGLDALGAEHPRLALFELGASAGLNLGVDEDRIDYGGFQRGPGTRLQLGCDWRGPGAPPPESAWSVVARHGVDPAPVSVEDANARRWLQACLWPHDRARHTRLSQALAWAQGQDWRVQPCRDEQQGLDQLQAWQASLPAAVQPVLLTSWVLAYLQPAALAAFHQRALHLVRERGLAWICLEPLACHPLSPLPPAAPEPTACLLSLHRARGSQALLWAHAHGRWARPVGA